MKSNAITLIILTLLVAAAAYWYFFTGTGNQAPLTTSVPLENAAQTQFQALVSKLQPISFNTEIFSDPRFTSLASLSTPITPEAPGRLDPFAVILGVKGM